MLPPRLLVDHDGDGYADSLVGSVYVNLTAGAVHVGAAAELVAWLTQKTLRLPLEVRPWSLGVPAIFIGRRPPATLSPLQRGAELHFGADSLLLVGETDADLLLGAKRFNSSALQAGLQALLAALFRTTLELPLRTLAFRAEGVTLTLGSDLFKAPDWDVLPQDVEAVQTPNARYVNPHARPYGQMPQGQRPKRHFGLAQALQGGGLFTGSRYAPEHLVGGLSVEAPLAEALELAARLSTVGLYSPQPLTTTPEAASVRCYLDKTSSAEVRVREAAGTSVLEVVGGSKQALARAATYFVQRFPYLPDGTDLEDLEVSLAAFLRGETPFGRVAKVAALQAHSRVRAQRALLSNPPPTASRLLGLPVTNTARDGSRMHWKQSFPWEGGRLLDALRSAKWQPGDEVLIEGFVSEAASVRKTLERRVEALCEEQGVAARVRLRSAFKPGLCWLLEDIGPRLASLDVETLLVCCAEQTHRDEAADRWLRELYPAAELLEQRYGVSVSLTLTESKVTYRAIAVDKVGQTVLEAALTPPVTTAPLNGIPELGIVSTTTGQVSVYKGDALLLQKDLPTDRDLFWAWFTQTVLPTVRATVAPGDRGPYFGELSIVVATSEPDEPLGIDHEHLSATESLHEDLYFGTLEALHYAAGLDTKDRSLAPGRILPFCSTSEGGDTSAIVTLRAPASHSLGLLDTAGRVHEGLRYPLKVRVTSVRPLSKTALQVVLVVELNDVRAAQSCKAQLEWVVAHRQWVGLWDPFPHGCDLTVHLQVAGEVVDALELPRVQVESETPSLPSRQLLTREVVHYSQHLARNFPNVHLRVLRESLYGEPLVALEALSSASYTSRARSAAWKPTILISARQHANEPTSTNAMLIWLEDKLGREGLLDRLNIVFHPLENPDGARLHQALSQLAPRHMHHAARYTGLGADLQTNPTCRGAVIPESQLRLDTWKRWHPEVHLNCHGYPAHEWLRANGGYLPRHFEAWSLPFGYFTILTGGAQDEVLLRLLKSRVAEALATHPHLQRLTTQQVQRALRYLKSSRFPFTLEQGFPFLSTLHEEESTASPTDGFTPTITLITEVPDETVSDTLWQWCVEAHQVIAEAVTKVLGKSQNRSAREPRQK